jgi:hypothetical protein
MVNQTTEQQLTTLLSQHEKAWAAFQLTQDGKMLMMYLERYKIFQAKFMD